MLLIYSAISLHSAVCAILFRPNIPPKRSRQHGKKCAETDIRENQNSPRCTLFMLEYFPFVLFVVGYMFHISGHSLMMYYTPLKGREKGLTSGQVASLMSVLGMTGNEPVIHNMNFTSNHMTH